MPNTSVHLPADLLDALNRLARERRVPRNRIIVQALREAVERRGRRWPPGYFEGEHLTDRDLKELRAGRSEFDDTLREARTGRRSSPF